MRALAALPLPAALLLALSAPAPAAANSAPPFLTYARPAGYQAVVTTGIHVPVSDPSVGYLSCDLYRPGTTTSTPAPGQFPGVVYQFHGYGTNRANTDPPQQTFLAQHGYNSLQCNVRGSGGSPGTIDILGPTDKRDGYDIVEWLGTQAWSTGDIGMIGYSYGAITALQVAGARPPHLRTVVPQASYEDLYPDIAYLGGIRTLDVRGWLLVLLEALNTQTTPPAQLLQIEQQGLLTDQAFGAHPLRSDAFWDQYAIDYGAIKQGGIPILDFGGWYDIYQHGMPAVYQRLPDQSWLVMNNVSHIDSPTFYGTASGPTLAWLDRWLMHMPAPLPNGHVVSYEMPATGGNGWTEFPVWPPPGIQPLTLHLDGGGILNPAPDNPGARSYTVNPADGMPTYWNIGNRPDTSDIVAWNTAQETVRMHFTSGALTQDLVMAGDVRATVNAAFSAAGGYLVLRLNDVAPNGAVTLVSTGWRNASVTDDFTASQPVVPGQMRTYQVGVWPSHWRFLAGHRIEVSISSGDLPRIPADAPAGTVTVGTGTGGSQVVLPALSPSNAGTIFGTSTAAGSAAPAGGTPSPLPFTNGPARSAPPAAVVLLLLIGCGLVAAPLRLLRGRASRASPSRGGRWRSPRAFPDRRGTGP